MVSSRFRKRYEAAMLTLIVAECDKDQRSLNKTVLLFFKAHPYLMPEISSDTK